MQEPSRNSRSGLKGFLTNHLLRPHGWWVGEHCGHWGAPGAPIQELNFQVFREKYSRWREDHVRKPSFIECKKNHGKTPLFLDGMNKNFQKMKNKMLLPYHYLWKNHESIRLTILGFITPPPGHGPSPQRYGNCEFCLSFVPGK